MDAYCRIELLGGLRVTQGERVITRFRTQKAASLLVYLACHLQQSHPREVLIEMLWPEVEPGVGRHRLSLALSSLRRQLEPPGVPTGSLLQADRHALRLNPRALTTDVADFEAILRQAAASQSNAARAQRLAQAIQLYGGELLPGFYDPWVQTEQQRLAEMFFQAIRQLVAHLVKADDLDGALTYALRALSVDPLREEVHHDLMRLYAAQDRAAEALRQYRELEHLLREELDLEPSAETRALAETLVGKVGLETLGVERRKKKPSTYPPVSLPATSLPTPDNAYPTLHLPLQLTRFFGREEEMARLRELLSPATASACRLVTLSGAGGTGKTRLAIEMAGRLGEQFAGGIWFVPLADLSDPQLMPGAIVDALGLPRLPNVSPLDQAVVFLNGLNRKQEALGVEDATLNAQPARLCLLVLDNLEHLLWEDRDQEADGAGVVRSLLERCPALACLVTSRQRLDLDGERELPVAPLPIPQEGQVIVEWLSLIASVQLFVDRAQAIRPDFQLTSRSAPSVAGLCARLEGIPLAIELAAARIQVLSPAQMLAQLERRFEFLVSRRRDAIERHRTLWAAVEWSYRLLSPEVQRFFCRLSVFRGGWLLEAAEAVCQNAQALEYLSQLRESSLVLAEEQEGNMRFHMLETLREFGQEQLSAEERAATCRRHQDFFLALAEEAELQYTEPQGALWFQRIKAEHDNLRAALQWSFPSQALYRASRPETAQASEAGLRLAAALWDFWITHGFYAEGRRWLSEALQEVESASPATRTKVLFAAGNMAWHQDDNADAEPLLNAALACASEVGDTRHMILSLNALGGFFAERRDFEQAVTLFEKALALARWAGEEPLIFIVLHRLGLAACERGDYARATSCIEEGLVVAKRLGRNKPIALINYNMAILAYYQGNYAEAHTFWLEALKLFWEFGTMPMFADCLSGLAAVCVTRGQPVRAVRLLAAAETHCEAIGGPLAPTEQAIFDNALSTAREALGEEAFAAAWAEGRAMTLEQGIAYARQEDT